MSEKRGTPAKKKSGFFTKLKQVFGGSSSNGSSRSVGARSLTSQRSRQSSLASDDAAGGVSFGVAATRTRSKSSFIFGGGRERQQQENAVKADAALEERRAKCMAIKLAKRDPPAVQRLLVDCEFCNPPPKFGRIFEVPSNNYTSSDTETQLKQIQHADKPLTAANELEWNPGLREWVETRKRWLTTTAEAQPVHHLEKDLTPDRYYTVYEKLIYQTRPFKHPLNLQDLVQILVAGWVGEGADAQMWSSDTEFDDAVESETAASQAASKTNSKITTTTSASTSATKTTASTSTTVAGSAAGGTKSQPETPALVVQHADEPSQEVQHVQFSDRPHPRAESNTKSDKFDMAPLSRVQSAMGVPLHPVVSEHSSMISITDSD